MSQSKIKLCTILKDNLKNDIWLLSLKLNFYLPRSYPYKESPVKGQKTCIPVFKISNNSYTITYPYNENNSKNMIIVITQEVQ